MQGTIAQLISIAAHGNEYLAGRLDDDYFPESSTFMFCKFVKFIDLQDAGSEWHENEFAADPVAWFKKLEKSGVVQLRVRYVPAINGEISDRMSVAFAGGGGRWLLEAVKPANSDFWEASWEVGDGNDPERKIWQVKYGRISGNSNQPMQPLPSVQEVREQLREILRRISDFAHRHDLDNFGKSFDRGLMALDDHSIGSDNEYHIFPEGYAAPDYHQLLNACQRAWVFGGMGSWNDIGFDDDATNKEYEELSDELFSLINLSLIVASNPFPRPTENSEETGHEQSRKWWQFWNTSK